MLYDCHTHCAPFSHDASQSVDELLSSADRLRLGAVCITDHYEKDVFYEGGREDIFDPDDYFRILPPLKTLRPASGARLLIGVEIGYLPHLTGYLADFVRSRPFDSVILSLHIMKGADPFIDPALFSLGKRRLYAEWLRETIEMIKRCPDFDILGHFDYISRYGPFPDRKMRYAEMPDVFDDLLGTLAGMGKALEINTRTVAKLMKIGYAGPDAWPDSAILDRFRDLGGRHVTLGSDAHHAGEAGLLFAEGAAWLHQQGWQTITHYADRMPVLSAIMPPAMISPSR